MAVSYTHLDVYKRQRRYCEARVWSYFNMFTDRCNEFLPYILGETNTPMPLFVKDVYKRQGLRYLPEVFAGIPLVYVNQRAFLMHAGRIMI